MRGMLYIRMLGALIACAGAAVSATPAAAQGSYSPYNETPAAALARYVRALADNPQDFASLVGAGRAALELGDTQAAAGFFARADEVNPKSPLPQAGMGAVSVANAEPLAALPYFSRAQQLGASAASFSCDRGLAYDLLGKQAQAQVDYRLALNGPDADEATRRLALSLAISGNKAAALDALGPLMAKGDAEAARARAFVLALDGDTNGAMVAFDAAMPGSWSRVSPFLQRLPTLQAGQKAAAVNLGIFPDAGDAAYAYSAPARALPSAMGGTGSVSTEQPAAPQVTQIAYAPAPRPVTAQRTAIVPPSKVWLQLASGPNADALQDQFARLKSKNRDLFDGIHGFVARSPDRSRLVIGPFHGQSDAEIFAEDLQTVGIDSSEWSNSQTDTIVPLGTE
jgi:Flp pilus assembly protein TadD